MLFIYNYTTNIVFIVKSTLKHCHTHMLINFGDIWRLGHNIDLKQSPRIGNIYFYFYKSTSSLSLYFLHLLYTHSFIQTNKHQHKTKTLSSSYGAYVYVIFLINQTFKFKIT